jgi:hypothetical protein
VDGYALSTHPDLCERVEALAEAAGGRFGYVYGRPVVASADDVIVAFGAGTHIFCLRLPREECGPGAVPELDALVSGEWTRVDPWAVETAAALMAALPSPLMVAPPRLMRASGAAPRRTPARAPG